MFKPEKIIELENIKKKEDKQFTVTQLLKYVPLTLPAYKDIKEGLSIPKVSTLEKIAIFYGVDMNCFFTNMKQGSISNEEYKSTEVNNEILWDRIEKQAVRINKLEEELIQQKRDKRRQDTANIIKMYALQDVQNITAAEPEIKLENKNK